MENHRVVYTYTWNHIELEVGPCPYPLCDYLTYPPAVGDFYIPESLGFFTPMTGNHNPLQFNHMHVVDMSEQETNATYNLLIKWCMTHSYWFYILGIRQVHDKEFDYIKSMILYLEENMAYEIEEALKPVQYPCTYSPTKHSTINTRGEWRTCNPCLWNKDYYPQYLQDLFAGFPENIQNPLAIDFKRRWKRAAAYTTQWAEPAKPMPPPFLTTLQPRDTP